MKAAQGKEFEIHPVTDGPIRAVITKITEPKERTGEYGTKWKFAIVFETEKRTSTGEPFTIRKFGYTALKNNDGSFSAITDEKSNLYKDVVKILGEFPKDFDTDMLIGTPVRVEIDHTTKEGKTYDNITYLGRHKGDNPYRSEAAPDTGSSYQKSDSAPDDKESWQQTKVHVGNHKGQQIEDLPEEALLGLINKWIPKTQEAGYKTTADDRRLLNALAEAQKVMAAAAKPADDY